MAPQLSVVLPAYNEADRLPPYLTEVRAHLESAYPKAHEVIVVDDGSADETAAAVGRSAAGWPALTLIRLPGNQGKGAAVRAGMLAARGRRLLFADADGATPIAEEWKLAAALARGVAVAVGSRAGSAPGVQRARSWRRAALGGAFAWAARRALGLSVRDTQCGFKMFDRAAGHALFSLGYETGYLFDLELLALAARLGLAVEEVPVSWAERPGSKVRFARDGWRMARGLVTLRRRLAALRVPPLVAAEARRAA